MMNMEYYNVSKSVNSVSYDTTNCDYDCDGLIDYSGDNFQSETSAKASSSSMHDSITNMSNSHSTPEDNSSENALLSPGRQSKMEIERESSPHDHYSSMATFKTMNNIREIEKPIRNLSSIDDTIECVLAKIREENEYLKSGNNLKSEYFNQTTAKSHELSNCASNFKNLHHNNSVQYVCQDFRDTKDLLTQQIRNSAADLQQYRLLDGMTYSTLQPIPSNYSKSPMESQSQQPSFYNYQTGNNNYFISPPLATSFQPNHQLNIQNSNFNKIDYSRPPFDKNKFVYYPYHYQTAAPFREFIPNSYQSPQIYYRTDSQVMPLSNQCYQLNQKSGGGKRSTTTEPVPVDEVNKLYKDSTNFANFKAPQNNTFNYLEQQNTGCRKKRSNNSEATTKLTPTKKRKLTNQSCPTTNSLDDLLLKLKVNNYSTLLMNPTFLQSATLLPPQGFIDSKYKVSKKSVKYRKYKSSVFTFVIPKRFVDQKESDCYLNDYLDDNSILNQQVLTKPTNIDYDSFSDIICPSPDDCIDISSRHHVDDVLCNLSVSKIVDSNPLSPELTISSDSLIQNNAFQTNDNYQTVVLPNESKTAVNNLRKHVVTPVVAYKENDTRIITEIHPSRTEELNNANNNSTYIQLSGSFLKRTKINGKSFSNIHIEEAVSIASLTASKNQNSCHYCCSFLSGLTSIRKSGRSIGLESNDDYFFCSSSCYSNFKTKCSSLDCSSSDMLNSIVNSNTNNNNCNNSNLQSTQIRIKTTPYKPPSKNNKKLCDFEQYVRRRFPSEGQNETVQKPMEISNNDMINKRLLGINYNFFKNERHSSLCKEVDKDDQNYLLKKYSYSYRSNDLVDKRLCMLCQNVGDGDEAICGRLINVDADSWVHLNCGLWCFEVFETVSGSLMDVQSSLQKALKTCCSHCSSFGAGIQCYRNKCQSVYHVPCAYKIGCIFYTDRGMYCPNHAVLNHPMHLKSLRVDRRVLVYRDESALIARAVSDDDHELKIKFRTGSLILNCIGQLLPEQLTSGRFNSSSIIYPVGYHVTRIYWSVFELNKRCKYQCSIEEDGNLPLFVIRYVDNNGCETVLSDRCCDNLWKSILVQIAKLREDAGLTRLFPLYLSGEQLFGLTEPHIIRVIESLPGVEMIKNYAFKFGKMQLITEMPLAINPTGSARTEPKLRTYVRRVQLDENTVSGSEFKSITMQQCGVLKPKASCPYLYEPLLSRAAIINSKTLQYKKMKHEWMDNVILSRSKIQGLGLFAARDFEKSSMIIEYIGELIRNEVGNRREMMYQARNNSIYMFRLNEDLIIDATVQGGLARYINHSCNPNCVAELISLDCGDRIIITTKQRIEKGEELSYDYKFDFEDNKSDRIPCLCGSINCRKWMN